jgi:hypothetical protein
MRGGGDCGVSANECSCAHGAQINFGDLPLYLTYEAYIELSVTCRIQYKTTCLQGWIPAGRAVSPSGRWEPPNIHPWHPHSGTRRPSSLPSGLAEILTNQRTESQPAVVVGGDPDQSENRKSACCCCGWLRPDQSENCNCK